MSEKKKKKKEKKEKVVYIDDGRTLADMSSVSYGRLSSKASGDKSSRSRAKDIWQTYWNAVKSMFLPMLITLGILTLAFLLLYLFMS